MQRTSEIVSFLNTTDWRGAKIAPLAGDASNRKYWRILRTDGLSAVLMDAPNDQTGSNEAFLSIAQHLTKIGLTAPKVYAQNLPRGLILMQDFGDGLYFDVVTTHPDQESSIYHAALDVLDHLHTHEVPPNIPPYGIAEMAEAAGLATQWYGKPTDTLTLISATTTALSALDWSRQVLVLRDYHAQNLIWRPNAVGRDRVGLLDFQDAQVGHPIYDAASLLNDARRDVGHIAKSELKQRLHNNTQNFNQTFATISAQRNLRILGVFARLCIRDGKRDYVDLIPRVWDNLWEDLSDPNLQALAKAAKCLPPPTPEHLESLRDQCATPPKA